MGQILLAYVEDDPMSRDVMELLVETSLDETTIVMFGDSRDFIGKFDSLPRLPDLIMLDIHVDPHDGFTMLETLRGSDKYGECKIIALTASVMNEEVRRLRDAGFDGVIGKPIDQASFPDLILRILDGEHIWHVM